MFVAASPGRAERTIELLADYEIRARSVTTADDLDRAGVLVATGQLSRGFHVPAAKLRLFAETDLFEEERRVHERRKSAARTFISDFRDLKIGDLVVHVDNGIGRFVGLKKLARRLPGMPEQEFMELRYAGDDKLFVPLDRLDLVQKYTGGASPALDKLGGTTWEKAKSARQEGHARHGRGAAEALRRAQSRHRPRVQRRTRTGSRSSPTSSSTS